MFRFFGCFILTIIAYSCEVNTPKPKGFPRLEYPDPEYQKTRLDFPYHFKKSTYSLDNLVNQNKKWMNLIYPNMGATIYLTYYDLKEKDFKKILSDAQSLVYEHAQKANRIGEKPFINKEKKVYGMMYKIEGQVASDIQFYLTDSTNHFLNGALYFYSDPNPDSIAPALNYIENDIAEMIETFEWKNTKK